MSDMLQIIGDKFYATAKAYIVTEPQDMPREMAAEFEPTYSNPSFIWIAGRYVQSEKANKNGHVFRFEDLQKGEASIRYTPVNALHKYDRPIGTVVQTKIVDRETATAGVTQPEIQALSVVWAASAPDVALEIRAAHKQGTLYYSMECVSEEKQCLACERTFAFAAEGAELCEHLGSNPKAPRRFINPIFLGAALIFPPDRPAWQDAEITDLASFLTEEYASRNSDAAQWESLMAHVMADA